MDLKYALFLNINLFKWKNITNVVIVLFEVNGFKNINITNGLIIKN
jgi:hypothetical protein